MTDYKEYSIWKSALAGGAAGPAYRKHLRAADNRTGAFLELTPEGSTGGTNEKTGHSSRTAVSAAEDAAYSTLAGLPFAVKDNIAVSGFRLTCASRALEDLKSPYTATAVQRLQDSGAVVIGKTNMDEFGMGSSTDTSALRATHNPWDPTKSAGGSSGGSAAAVAAGMVPFALGSDTGGSVRQPASFCGVYGLKPTYGTVSRYGLVSYASSLEGIGVLSADIDLLKHAFEQMRGIDPLDQTSLDQTSLDPPLAPGAPEAQSEPKVGPGSKSGEAARIGFIPGLQGLSEPIEHGYRSTTEAMQGLGYGLRQVELPTLEYVVPAYYTIASAEASSNLARYTGIRYGYRNEWAEDPRELVETSRDESLGPEVKLRILLGTYVLRSGFQDEYYLRAQKVRTAIRNDFQRIFKQIDLLLLPVYPVQAFDHGSSALDPFTQKLADKFTAAANLAGLPALSFPTGFAGGLPVGMQLIGPMFGEQRLLETARAYRRVFEPKLVPGALEWMEEREAAQ